jgi:outer membrane protein assembly factor BamB
MDDTHVNNPGRHVCGNPSLLALVLSFTMRGFWVGALLSTALAASPALADSDDWSHWRGPNRNGVARGDAPLEWSDTENVKWKVEVPGRGFSSPVLWGDKIFLTTAIQIGEPEPAPEPPTASSRNGAQGGPPSGAAGGERRRRGGGDPPGPQPEQEFVVMALNRTSGEVIWKQTATTATPHEGYHRKYGSFASATPATDGERLYAFFGSRGLYCYDLDGKLLWKKDLGQFQMRNAFGEGVAPVIYGDSLIVNVDHEGDSFIVVLDKKTGDEKWRKSRDERSNWTEPFALEHDGHAQIIVSAMLRVISYDLETGDIIWECGGLGGNVIPVPVVEDGIVYVMSGWRDPNLLAIKLGGTGDLTGTDAVLWSEARGTAYTASPVLEDGRLYVLTDRGMISCFNAKTGEPYYHQQRLTEPYNFKASLVAANGKLYLSSENEDVIVLKMGDTFEVLATNTITDESFIASPAIAGGQLLLRGQNHLYCIEYAKGSPLRTLPLLIANLISSIRGYHIQAVHSGFEGARSLCIPCFGEFQMAVIAVGQAVEMRGFRAGTQDGSVPPSTPSSSGGLRGRRRVGGWRRASYRGADHRRRRNHRLSRSASARCRGSRYTATPSCCRRADCCRGCGPCDGR